MPLINCEIRLQLKWSKKCILLAGTAANQVPEFTITDTKVYVHVTTLSTQDNVNSQNLVLKEQFIGININLKKKGQAQNKYLDFLIYPSF